MKILKKVLKFVDWYSASEGKL